MYEAILQTTCLEHIQKLLKNYNKKKIGELEHRNQNEAIINEENNRVTQIVKEAAKGNSDASNSNQQQ